MLERVPELMQIQQDLAEVSASLDRMRAIVAAMLERQRRPRTAEWRYIKDAQGVVSVRED